jgi:hypothetical protein
VNDAILQVVNCGLYESLVFIILIVLEELEKVESRVF